MSFLLRRNRNKSQVSRESPWERAERKTEQRQSYQWMGGLGEGVRHELKGYQAEEVEEVKVLNGVSQLNLNSLNVNTLNWLV